MLGPTPISEPINLQEPGKIGRVCEERNGIQTPVFCWIIAVFLIKNVSVFWFGRLACVMSYVHACWPLICIFSLSAGVDEVNMSCWIRLLAALHSEGKTQKDAVASGWGRVTHCLTVTWLLRVQWLLNLRGAEA